MNVCLFLLSLYPAAGLQEPPAPRTFPPLKTVEREKLDKALFQMRSAKTAKARGEARAAVAGAAAVPACLQAFAKFDAERLADLRGVLDQVLVAADLDLALAEAGPTAAPAARYYVARRLADSPREDGAELLHPLLADADPELAYQAARGLALRGDARAVAVLHAAVRDRWKEGEKALREDLAAVPRGPLSAAASATVQNGDRDQRLAGIRLFSLIGTKEHARVLRPALDDPDQQILLNAINACRAVVDGAPPLERPSSPQIIEQVQLWKGKL